MLRPESKKGQCAHPLAYVFVNYLLYRVDHRMAFFKFNLFKMVKKRLKLEEMIFNFDTTTWHNYFLENKIDVKVDFDSILLSK
jgi:hypothetical protein